jgi:cell division protein FtsN
VINILCDRALETAYERKQPLIDAAEILAAASLLRLPVPLTLRLTSRRSLAAAAALAFLTVGGALTYAMLQPGEQGREAPAQASEAPSSSNAPAPITSGEPLALSLPPGAAAKAPAAVAPLPVAPSFTVVAASFRTPGPARSVAAQATGLGLPAFTRVTDGPWHQVVVGPYASREEAADAQRRLATVNLNDTRIVATAPESAARPNGAEGKSE